MSGISVFVCVCVKFRETKRFCLDGETYDRVQSIKIEQGAIHMNYARARRPLPWKLIKQSNIHTGLHLTTWLVMRCIFECKIEIPLHFHLLLFRC